MELRHTAAEIDTEQCGRGLSNGDPRPIVVALLAFRESFNRENGEAC